MLSNNSKQIAELVFNSFQKYYKIFGSKKKVLRLISKELKNKQGETFKSIKKFEKKKIIGILFYYNYEEFEQRTLSSSFNLNLKLNSLKGISKFSKSIQKIKRNHSLYISRISVNRLFKKRGFGSDLVEKLIKIAKIKNKKFILLHVDNKNIHAIKFYLKNSFFFLKRNKKYRYNIMCRKI